MQISTKENVEPEQKFESFKNSVENVLGWMLASEEKLDTLESIADLPEAKKLWNDHEVCDFR